MFPFVTEEYVIHVVPFDETGTVVGVDSSRPAKDWGNTIFPHIENLHIGVLLVRFTPAKLLTTSCSSQRYSPCPKAQASTPQQFVPSCLIVRQKPGKYYSLG